MKLFRLVNATATLILLFDLFVANPEPPATVSSTGTNPAAELAGAGTEEIRIAVALTGDDELIVTDSTGVVASFPADSLRNIAGTPDSSQTGKLGALLSELLQRLEAIEETVENYRETLTDSPGTLQYPGLLQCLRIK